jgi:hypothetical protein
VTFHKCYCFIALCDGCGEDCWTIDAPPHYASEAEARRELRALYEWRITRQVTGRFEMLCGRCADREDCAKYGCRWGTPELDHGTEQQDRWDAEHPEPLQMCGRCGTVRRDHEPAVSEQPDAPSRPLTAQEAADFAALYLAAWPDTSPAALNDNPITDYTYRGDET